MQIPTPDLLPNNQAQIFNCLLEMSTWESNEISYLLL